MKLAKINHDRCGERQTSNYVWVADDMIASECDWGHRHGMQLDYGGDK